MNIWEEIYTRRKKGKAAPVPADQPLNDAPLTHGERGGARSYEEVYYQNGRPQSVSTSPPLKRISPESAGEAYYQGVKPQPAGGGAEAPKDEPTGRVKPAKHKFTPRPPSDKPGVPYPAILTKMGHHLAATWANILVESKTIMETALICGAGGKEGATFVSYHLALFLSREYNMKVLYVDTNLRHTFVPNIQKLPGLYSYALENKDLATLVVRSEYPGFHLLPSGAGSVPRNVNSNILSREPVEKLIRFCRDNFDVTIIDGQPLAVSPVMIEFARLVDVTILVCRYGFTRREVSQLAIDKLQKFGITNIGVILNDRQFPVPQALYRHMG